MTYYHHHHKNKDYRKRATGRSALFGLLPIVLTAMILFFSAQNIYGAVPLTTGSSTVGNTLEYGTTSYTISYSYPSTVQVGTNMNMTLTMRVNSLTGLVEYTTTYSLLVIVFIGSNQVVGNVTAPNGSPFLYPGSDWGPNNVTIPITAANTGLTAGQTGNASVSIILNDYIFYGGAVTYYSTEPPMTGGGGTFIVQDAVQTSSSASSSSAGSSTSTSSTGGSPANGTQNYLPYVLLGAGAVLLIGAIVLPRGPRPVAATPAPPPQTT
jgi:hypothetical protein